MSLRFLSLRNVVPISFIGSALVLAVISFLWRLAWLHEEVEEEFTNDAKLLMQIVGGDVESSLRTGDVLHARAMIIRSSAARELDGAALFDADGRVVFSTDLATVGESIEATQFAVVQERLSPARADLGTRAWVSWDDGALFTTRPVLLRDESSDLLPSRVGVLVMRHDLARAKARGFDDAVADVLFGLLPVGVLGLLVAVLFHTYLSRRAQALVDATNRIAKGDYSAEPLAGRDELALISRAIARMAEEIARQRRREKLMVAELDHRVKNSLSLVLALVDETLADTDTREAFANDFEGRIHSLAMAHEALAASRWEGVALAELVRRTLAPVAREGDRLRLEGPAVLMSPEATVPLALALHELATNAAKYGGFSLEEGAVDVRWDRLEGQVRLRWSESGGPPVTAPERPGLGTALILGLIEQELGGEVAIDYEATGLRCEITLPSSHDPG